MVEPCQFRRAIDRHFAGTIAVPAEHAMRAHLPTCDACDAYYRRHLVLEAMTPGALGPQQRLARGLGIARRPRARWVTQLAAVAAIASILVLVVLHHGADAGMTVRGGTQPASELIAFEIRGDAHGELGRVIAADSELSFAYRNVAGKPYLLVFGIDDLGRVYWYYPAWADPAHPPSAVAIAASSEIVELPEAIRHDLAGTRLWIYAAFVTRPWSTVDVEAAAAAVAPGGTIALEAPVAPAYAVAVRR